MKNGRKPNSDELRDEYDFAAIKPKPNRFAHRTREQMVVLLDKDLSKVFKTPEEVNHALRSLLDAVPERRRKAA